MRHRPLLKAMAVTTPLSSPLIRVMSADSMATSVPVPMAIPTSAWARAGASLIPSPTMPTRLPFGLELFHLAGLGLRQDLGQDAVDTDLFGNGIGGPLVIPGHHDDLKAQLVEGIDRCCGILLQGIGHGDNAGRPAIHCHKHRGLSFLGEGRVLPLNLIDRHPLLLHQLHIPQ